MNSDLAKLFSELLIKEIGEDSVKETIVRNTASNQIGVCHSHDFCDANMVMLDAWCKLNKKNSDGFFYDDVYDTVNIAWNEAIANNFYVRNEV